MAHTSPKQQTKSLASQQSQFMGEDSFPHGPRLEGQPFNDEISPRNSIATPERRPRLTDLESGQSSFIHGPQLESQPIDDEILPGNSIAISTAQDHPTVTELKSEHDHSLVQHGIYWPIPSKMLISFALGVITAGVHYAWYHYLDAKIVRSPRHQEKNIRFANLCSLVGVP